MGNTFGTLALVFGLIACCCGIIFGPLAIIFGAIGMGKDDETTLAIIGLILGLICTICWVLLIIFLFI